MNASGPGFWRDAFAAICVLLKEPEDAPDGFVQAWRAPMLRRLLAAFVILVLMLAIPLGWGYLEYRAAADRSRLSATIGAQWASDRLGAVLSRFETIAIRLRPGATPAENAALTARLLRLEPQLHPATALFVLGPSLRMVAATHPMDGEGIGAEISDWLRAVMDRSVARIALRDLDNQPLLGMASHLALARRIEEANGSAGGVVLTLIDRSELRELINPAWLRSSGNVRLADDATGRIIASYAADGAPPEASSALSAIRRAAEALMGEHRVQAQVTTNHGLTWSVDLDPWNAMALDDAGLRERGLAALGLALILATLTFLTAAAFRGASARMSMRPSPRPDIESRKTTPLHAEVPVRAESTTTPHGVAECRSSVEDILDSNYVDPRAFDALVHEFGRARAGEMVREFLVTADLWLPRLVSLAADRAWPAFAGACLELSGVTATFGALRVSETLGELGKTGDEGTTIDVAVVVNEWRLTKRALSNLLAHDGADQAARGEAA